MVRLGASAVLLGGLVASPVICQPLSGLREFSDIDDKPTIPVKAECEGSNYQVRWASSTVRIYIECETGNCDNQCATLGQVYNRLPSSARAAGALTRVGPNSDRVWRLEADLYVEDGVTLQIFGEDYGGVVNELQITSDPRPFNIRGYGGNLDIRNTWIHGANSDGSPQTDYEDGRSYISCITEVSRGSRDCTKTGPVQGTCRMDVADSEISHLGYPESESYGLVWKARGLCTDLSNLDIFDDVGVYGNMYRNNVHDLYFGMYTYGHQNGIFNRNEVHDNVRYGFDPHDDSDWLRIHYNTVYNNGDHNIIASKRCDHVSIQNNIVYGGENVGIFLHRNSNNAIVRGNLVYNNEDAGIALLEITDSLILRNTIRDNGFGVRLSVGCRDNRINNNTIRRSERYGLYCYIGSDEPDLLPTGRVTDNRFLNNRVTGQGEAAVFLDGGDDWLIRGNTFYNVELLRFRDTEDTEFVENTGVDGLEIDIEDSSFTSNSQIG